MFFENSFPKDGSFPKQFVRNPPLLHELHILITAQ